MSEHGLPIVLSGPSGVEKGTMQKTIFESGDNDSQYSIPMTTRKMREGEVEGVDYFLRNKEKFESVIKARGMLEYVECAGNYYGTPLPYVNKILGEGKDVFLETEVRGAKQVRERMSDGVFIFLTSPDLTELKSRIVSRETGADEVIKEQMKVAGEEIEMMTLYGCAVIGNGVPLTVERIKNTVTGEHFRVDRVIGKYIKILKET